MANCPENNNWGENAYFSPDGGKIIQNCAESKRESLLPAITPVAIAKSKKSLKNRIWAHTRSHALTNALGMHSWLLNVHKHTRHACQLRTFTNRSLMCNDAWPPVHAYSSMTWQFLIRYPQITKIHIPNTYIRSLWKQWQTDITMAESQLLLWNT